MTPEELNKAYEWLVNNLGYYDYNAVCIGESLCERIAKDFRKAMTYKTNPIFEKCLAKVNPETREEVRRNMDYANWTEKACEWLKEKAELYAELDYYDDYANSADEDVCKPCVRFDIDKFLTDFRKAMGKKSEKPTNLTWEDIRRIVEIADMLVDNQEPDNLGRFPSMEAYYTKVLNIFNEQRTTE